MGFEPNAAQRLQFLLATTQDPQLRSELRTALEAHGMPFLPSAELNRQIMGCPACATHDVASGSDRGREGLCEAHRARWNLELCLADSGKEPGEDALDRIMRGVLSSEQNGRALLAALDRQLRALQLVWEAHERGAIRLPERVAESVRLARLNVPALLPGERARVQQAS
jgi:hypothetical protein